MLRKKQRSLNMSRCVCFSIVFIGCTLMVAAQRGELKKWRITGTAQGTTYAITYFNADEKITKSKIDDLLQALDSSISIYHPFSIISRFNKSHRGCIADDHFRKVFEKAQLIHSQTGGMVDVGIKPLLDAWGFGPEKKMHKSDPSDKEIKEMLSYTGQERIYLKKDSIIKNNPRTELDMNGIGQGYAVDLIARYIESENIHNYLVEIGGEIRLKGSKPDGKKFVVGIGSVKEEDAIQLKVIPEDGAITTSGNYVKYRMSGNKKLSHIIDPKKGKPIQNEMISVTVWARDAITADGFDNGFMAMGLKKTLKWLKNKNDIGAYIIYKTPDGSIADTASKSFWQHVKLPEQQVQE